MCFQSVPLIFLSSVLAYTYTVHCYPNNKPWITTELNVLNKKKKAFRSWDRGEVRIIQHDLRGKLRESKDSYRRKLEARLQQNNVRDVWAGLRARDIQPGGSWRGQMSFICSSIGSVQSPMPFPHPHCT